MSINDIQQVICRVGNLETIEEDDVLGEAGFSSMNALALLMELEDLYDITIPDDRFIEARTPRDLYNLIAAIRTEQLV